MNIDDEMMTEEAATAEHPTAAPAEAAPATAALTAERAPESEAEAVPEEEQEDPYAGRTLPEEETASEDEEPEEEWVLEEDIPPAAAPQEDAPQVDVSAEEDAVAAPAPEAPAPAAPAAPAAEAARQQYWRAVLTGSAETVPDTVRERAGLDEAGLTEEQREYRLLGTINRSWAADNLGLSREQVRSGWSQLRRRLAQRYHVADDEQELFTALSVEAQDAPRRERVRALYEEHYRAALLGEPLPLPAAAEEGGEEDMPYARDLAYEAQLRGDALRRRYLPLAAEVAEGFNALAALEEDAVAAPRLFGSAPELARAMEGLAGLDERSRQLVYAMAQAEFRAKHPQKKESLMRTVMRSARRGATGLGIGAGQALAHTAVATLNSLGNALGKERGASLHGKADALDLRACIAGELRHALCDEVNPLQVSEEAGLAGQLLVDAAGATPTAAVAFCGGAGFASLGFSGMGEAVAAARSRAPEGSQWLQYLAGVVGGGIQAAIYSGMSRVGGQMLSNAIGRFARASGTGAGGYSLASLGVLGSMGAEEAKLLFASKAAEATGLATQELAARLDRTASNIDWKAYGDNALDVELNLREAAMTLPFILIGSGRVALRHFRSRDAVLGDGYALERWGMDEATRDAIMKERDINRQGDMLRDALRGSRRWSAPGFITEAMRALRLLNSDYYQGFKDPQVVRDFLKLPAQGSLVPRPPLEPLSPERPEHAAGLQERHGSVEKVNRSRLWLAMQLREEWLQKAHLVDSSAGAAGLMLPTSARRSHYAVELRQAGGIVPPYLNRGGVYVPQADAARMALLRDRSAELQDLSYQMLLSSFPLDALSHSTRGLNQLRQAGETARRSLLESVGRSVLRRAMGVPEEQALDELGQSVSDYFKRRRYSSFPPGWMSRVPSHNTRKLDEYAQVTWAQELAEAPPELLDAYRVALGVRSCASALYELLPILPDFQSMLARGFSPAESYVQLLSRELGVPMDELPEVKEMLAAHGRRGTDMRSFRLRNEELFNLYSGLTGYSCESARSEADGRELWRVRRPDGSCTPWHPRRSDAVNDMVANASFMFLPFSGDSVAPLRVLDAAKPYDLNRVGRGDNPQFTGYDNLCRVALRDTARTWLESAPYALPGFELGTLRRYAYLGGRKPKTGVLMQENDATKSMLVDSTSLSSPLRLVQARFRTYWWRQLRNGLMSAEQAGNELVKLRIMSPEELARVKDIARPLLMPKRKDVPLKDTPPPDVPGMNRALAEYLTEFSTRYFLAHLDDMPLPLSAREWFRLAPLCPLEPEAAPNRAVRVSLKDEQERLACLENRLAARELRETIPAVVDLRRAEREGLLIGSPLVEGLRRAAGLNRVLNLEQAWCAQQSGAEAMMAASPAYWRLVEQPLEGWRAMDAAEREILRGYVEDELRNDPVSTAMEAEARGETPDYMLHALQNLQEVLEDYPNLRTYGIDSVQEGTVLVRRLQPQERQRHDSPHEVPEAQPAAPYTGGALQVDARMGDVEALPEGLREDSRVPQALHLLGRLRSYPASRPHLRREGIHWKNAFYGGSRGRFPLGLERGWKYEEPLSDLIAVLRILGEKQAALPEGQRLNTLEPELPSLGDEELNLEPLRHVSLYRSRENPSVLCRLMPGEPEAANAAARVPYMVQSISGALLGKGLALRHPEDMYRAYTPLELFRPYRSRMGTDLTRQSFSQAALDYTLSGMLSSTMRMVSQNNPRGGLASLRELLLRFAEDSGLGRSLLNLEPHAYTSGQIDALRLGRELLLCVCGKEPEAAYRRFVRLGHRIRRRADARVAVQRALFRAAEELYAFGDSLFRKSEPRVRKVYKPKARPKTGDRGSRSDNQNLDDWIQDRYQKEYDEVIFHYRTDEESGFGFDD